MPKYEDAFYDDLRKKIRFSIQLSDKNKEQAFSELTFLLDPPVSSFWVYLFNSVDRESFNKTVNKTDPEDLKIIKSKEWVKDEINKRHNSLGQRLYTDKTVSQIISDVEKVELKSKCPFCKKTECVIKSGKKKGQTKKLEYPITINKELNGDISWKCSICEKNGNFKELYNKMKCFLANDTVANYEELSEVSFERFKRDFKIKKEFEKDFFNLADEKKELFEPDSERRNLTINRYHIILLALLLDLTAKDTDDLLKKFSKEQGWNLKNPLDSLAYIALKKTKNKYEYWKELWNEFKAYSSDSDYTQDLFETIGDNTNNVNIGFKGELEELAQGGDAVIQDELDIVAFYSNLSEERKNAILIGGSLEYIIKIKKNKGDEWTFLRKPDNWNHKICGSSVRAYKEFLELLSISLDNVDGFAKSHVEESVINMGSKVKLRHLLLNNGFIPEDNTEKLYMCPYCEKRSFSICETGSYRDWRCSECGRNGSYSDILEYLNTKYEDADEQIEKELAKKTDNDELLIKKIGISILKGIKTDKGPVFSERVLSSQRLGKIVRGEVSISRDDLLYAGLNYCYRKNKTKTDYINKMNEVFEKTGFDLLSTDKSIAYSNEYRQFDSFVLWSFYLDNPGEGISTIYRSVDSNNKKRR